jgi:hypothetical protein
MNQTQCLLAAGATDGKRLHRLDLDSEAAPLVGRIFGEFIAGHGFYAIAEGLTRDGSPSPSACDRTYPPRRSYPRGETAADSMAGSDTPQVIPRRPITPVSGGGQEKGRG